MLRSITGHDYEAAGRIYRTWPVRDVLERYRHQMREASRHAYELKLILWGMRVAMGSKEKPPNLPDVLR